ncbi:MAG: hypothetical protein ACD_87C00050G0004 [uncultured bacterium]|nr:MAG: hypothetical protein ACD_87C00050G0004 [uncultured bacterium]
MIRMVIVSSSRSMKMVPRAELIGIRLFFVMR